MAQYSIQRGWPCSFRDRRTYLKTQTSSLMSGERPLNFQFAYQRQGGIHCPRAHLLPMCAHQSMLTGSLEQLKFRRVGSVDLVCKESFDLEGNGIARPPVHAAKQISSLRLGVRNEQTSAILIHTSTISLSLRFVMLVSHKLVTVSRQCVCLLSTYTHPRPTALRPVLKTTPGAWGVTICALYRRPPPWGSRSEKYWRSSRPRRLLWMVIL